MGGAERILQALLDEGAERGWRQWVLNPFAMNPQNSDLKTLVSPVTYEPFPAARIAQLPRLRQDLIRAVGQVAPDIIQVFLPHAGILAASVPRTFGSRWIFSHQHGRHLVSAGRWGLAVLDAVALRRFDRVVACSRSVAEFLTKTYLLPSRRIQVIENGWSGSPRPPNRGARPTAICVANFRPEKNHEGLLRAFALVAGDVPESRLVLVGRGPLESRLKEVTATLGISKNVEFQGYVDDVWEPLSSAHVFVLPSREEAFGIAATEAMAAGLPVVSSAVGGLQDIVEPGVTGDLVPAGDVEALARALIRILGDDEARERMSRAAQVASKQYSIHRTVDAYFGLYERVLSRDEAA